MSFDQPLKDAIESVLRQHGDASPIRDIRQVGGGDINQAARIETVRRAYFVKWHTAPPPLFFECEANGLMLMAATNTARVPQVFGGGEVPDESTAFLVLEWIERGPSNTRSAETLGRQLAEMHRIRQDQYGFAHDNYIGRTPQQNGQSNSWLEFFQTQRLAPQRDLAAGAGRLPSRRALLLDQLIERLDEWIDDAGCQPSLLHGDLWGGNWMVASTGEPVLIDPAVYVGDREADLAMTSLFGGFPASFYAAYAEVFPLAAGYETREPIYQLYHLLNHLNLFGEGYGASVDAILARCVG